MRKVIYTVNVGGYDKPRRAPRFPGWDTVLFTDRASGLRLRLAGWTVRRFDTQGLAAGAASRRPKLLPHLYLADYDISLYVDANIVFHDDPSRLAEALGWPVFAAAAHPYRDNPYDEVAECVAQGKAPAAVLEAQAAAYRAEGLPGDAALYENNVLLRRHNDPVAVALDEAWWEEFRRFPHRDQISLPMACRRTGIVPVACAQDLKRRFVAARGHDRSLARRLRRSLGKRLARLGLG